MTDQALTNETAKLIADLRTMLESGSQFIAAQAPPLAQEILLQGRVRWTFWLSLGLIVGLVGFTKVHRAWRTVGLWDGDNDHPRPQVLYLIPTVIGTLMTFGAFRNCVLAWFAPRLYILEYVMSRLTDGGGCR